MVRPVRAIVIAVLVLLVAFASAWASLALWYRLPLPEVGRQAGAILFGLFGASVVVALFGRRRFRAVLSFASAFVLVLVWWSTIEPPANGVWAPDVARQVTGEFDGDLLTLTNVRDFEWRSATDFTERWTTRSYDLNKLKSVDMFMSYWSGPTIAHVIMSFGFDDGHYLAWSIEVRRLSGGSFSPLADLFKSSPLVILAADERDVIGLRSNFRGEDVQIYRLKMSPAAARLLLREYVSDANALAGTPVFYNSLTTNCTTTIVKMMRVAGDAVPTDWRLVVNGYLPEYAYDRGALDISVPLSQLRSAAHIAARAHEDGVSPVFSQAIRVGVPSPQGAL
ncbi:Lnb N-terminal periplasmic domain-containing protein [Rhizobium leguminosarum]|uniref:Lnb N-terminal periplasmic domain-containing protein n=1 Tax=Rhizobium leguminosarum TaxID=384 RepID=UPI003D01BA4F